MENFIFCAVQETSIEESPSSEAADLKLTTCLKTNFLRHISRRACQNLKNVAFTYPPSLTPPIGITF